MSQIPMKSNASPFPQLGNTPPQQPEQKENSPIPPQSKAHTLFSTHFKRKPRDIGRPPIHARHSRPMFNPSSNLPPQSYPSKQNQYLQLSQYNPPPTTQINQPSKASNRPSNKELVLQLPLIENVRTNFVNGNVFITDTHYIMNTEPIGSGAYGGV